MSLILQSRKKPGVPIYSEGKGLAPVASGNAVFNLTATSHPDGNRIDLAWTNPPGATNIRILRNKQAFPYDLSDPATTVYDSIAINAYSDTGVQGPDYYYYLIVVSQDNGATWEIEPSSRVFQLALDPTLKSGDWLWSNGHIPREMKNEDAKNGNVLRMVVEILGAGLNLLRGRVNAMLLLTDPNRTPLHAALFQSQALGFDPETSFDFNTSRRALSKIVNIYKHRGTVPGIVEFIRMFVQWDARIVEFGTGSDARVFQTWGGSLNPQDSGMGSTVSFADQLLTDTSKTWAVGQWIDSKVLDSIGNVLPVLANTATTLTLGSAIQKGTLSVAASNGDSSVHPDTTVGWSIGMIIQIRSGSLTDVRYITAIGGGVLTLNHPVTHAYPVGSTLFDVIEYPQSEIVGVADSGDGFDVPSQSGHVTDNQAHWGDNQWVGYYYLGSDNTKSLIKSNTATVLTVGGNASPGNYSIAPDFVLGSDFSSRLPVYKYSVYSGQHSFLYDPKRNLAMRGESDDPFQYLYGGSSSIQAPTFGLGDLGIYVPDVAEFLGKSTVITGNTLSDSALVGLPNHFFDGMWLNPNRNQSNMFRITAFNGTTGVMTVDSSSLDQYADIGNDYFVLTGRDSIRYARLIQRIHDFVPGSAKNVYVFFE